MEQVSKTVWEGAKLVVTTTSDIGGNVFSTTTAYSLDANGNVTLEVMAPGRGRAPTTTTLTYKKG